MACGARGTGSVTLRLISRPTVSFLRFFFSSYSVSFQLPSWGSFAAPACALLPLLWPVGVFSFSVPVRRFSGHRCMHLGCGCGFAAMLGSTGRLSPSHPVLGGTVAWSLLPASTDSPGGFLAHAARWSYSLKEFDAGVLAALSDSPACIVSQVHFLSFISVWWREHFHRSRPGPCRVSFW